MALIYHTIRFSLRSDAARDQVDAAMANLRRQGEEIESVTSFVVGPDVGGSYDVGATFVLEDLPGYVEYMLHPTHRRTDELGLPLVADMVSFDIVDDPDPDLPEKIRRVHTDRFAGDADLVALVEGLDTCSGSALSHDRAETQDA
ncbi:Dabb family protein [Quadrisphaera sp. DSM 44207]|uniref:Dabb family protein n=1 Tax=Quadrisphaera sp. DSM 44207 TaxID=1881057 RepID=UPI0008842C27|nr:Dabb family protein [Quadrisphaera sp. DSM 44207]SDQ44664.1 Stress responsive A/B Barrel Domain [Quadrisphaera sp. DSM 44207]